MVHGVVHEVWTGTQGPGVVYRVISGAMGWLMDWFMGPWGGSLGHHSFLSLAGTAELLHARPGKSAWSRDRD